MRSSSRLSSGCLLIWTATVRKCPQCKGRLWVWVLGPKNAGRSSYVSREFSHQVGYDEILVTCRLCGGLGEIEGDEHDDDVGERSDPIADGARGFYRLAFVGGRDARRGDEASAGRVQPVEPSAGDGDVHGGGGGHRATVPAGALQIRRIIDPNGWVIPEQGAEPGRYVGDLELGWLVFAGEIRFSRALIAGDYTVWYFTAHTFPGSDATTFTIPDSDIPLLIAGATVYAIEVRGRQEWKRGPLPARYSQAMLDARAAYSAAWRERRRVIRTSSLKSSS